QLSISKNFFCRRNVRKVRTNYCTYCIYWIRNLYYARKRDHSNNIRFIRLVVERKKMMTEVNTSHKWLLEGIDCANCAAKVESAVASIPGVKESNVNFMTETLNFEVSDKEEKLVLINVQEKINKLEPTVTLKNKADGQLINMNSSITLESKPKEDEQSHHEWLLEGIDCANCAAKIENGVSEIDGVINSNVNYMTQTLSFDLVAENDAKTLSTVKTKIKKLEPDIIPLIKATGQEVGEDRGLQSEKSCQKQNHKRPENWGINLTIGRLILAVSVLLLASFAPITPSLSFGLFVVAYLVAGYDVIWRAVRNIFNGQVFDENFLMTIATLAAFYVQEYPEAVAVMLFYQVGEVFQDVAVNKSRRSIADLMDIRPDYANVKLADGSTRQVSPESLQVGDTILVRPGEKVPLDGNVIVGSSAMDTSALT